MDKKTSAFITVENIITLITITILLIIWYVTTKLKILPESIIPSPYDVFTGFKEVITQGYKGNTIYRHFSDSMFRLITAFALAIATGIPIGLASGYSTKIRAVFEPIVNFFRPLPPLAYYALLIMWLGIGNSSKIMLLYLAAFPPVYISCVSGVKSIREDYINGAYTLGASRIQTFIHVIFPTCLPSIFTGLRTSMGFAYTTLVAAEMVAAVSGIGWMVLDASKFLRSDIIFVGIIIMGITGILLDRIIRIIEIKVVPWEGKE
ncbi:MAG: ABC transporter permease [Clostridium sp.]|jgi:taurine transport system permease protein|uniref:ABC transporter permease n=1 Tax=Clostridium sp. TaxID=1506 RepID=UPI0025BFADA9|nr:ABC transporter permease [Clostridium sp.]MCH3963679.1 ABC transporter permease [Clostridium sp.]MCI1714820.1 ABC transporter permease [Clostridium sp.]MCI1798991.1 ABC transporter permease [Clostridium sp.]MCI1813003.1 ABC transporter permease [Clostridium sp.]MCI1869893.1 ABC transporter permease [Clostridium sp.]